MEKFFEKFSDEEESTIDIILEWVFVFVFLVFMIILFFVVPEGIL